MHVEDGEFGVCREERGGDRTHVASGGREHGDGHCQGALPVAAEVMDGRHTRYVVPLAPVQPDFACVGHGGSSHMD